MIAQSPAVPFAPTLAEPQTRRGILGALAKLSERAGQSQARRDDDGQAYWTSIARGL